jgi:predicted CoA-substrate-specific enzyme activase
MYSIGIDIGYSAIKVHLLDETGHTQYHSYLLHKGKIQETLLQVCTEIEKTYAPEDIIYGAITGSGATIFAGKNSITSVNEIAALVEGVCTTDSHARAIIEIGGQSAKYITNFQKDDQSRIEIALNAYCAAGTGSFIEEQVSRLQVSLEDYSRLALQSNTIPRIAGRCSVFAKTDITHHQQQGVAVPDILMGLAYAVVKNFKATVMKRATIEKPVLFTGGVAYNRAIVRACRDIFHLSEQELSVSSNCATHVSLGAALLAGEKHLSLDFKKMVYNLKHNANKAEDRLSQVVVPPLDVYGTNDHDARHNCSSMQGDQCYLGVDIGSTSINLVLLDERNAVVAYKYLRSCGKPLDVVRSGLTSLEQEYAGRSTIQGVGITGSGRYLIGEAIGADVVNDEITAQARAAVSMDAQVDTIFEIGGQDSKYIQIEQGIVTDFQMNKICAAGTGSFIEEQAQKLGIPIAEFGEKALKGKQPVDLGERCTVFMGANITSFLAEGASLENIASGLCYSIVKNYLHRVVGQKKIGERIFLQGGIAYNQGIVNAFRALTGKEIYVPPFFSVTGAYGAALLAREGTAAGTTRYKGHTFRADPIAHQKAEATRHHKNNFSAYEKIDALLLKGNEGIKEHTKQTIGIPKILFMRGMIPLFNAFFKELGFNVLISQTTHETSVCLSQGYSLGDVCYPVQLVAGHVAELLAHKVAYIFIPSLYTMQYPPSRARQDFGCPYMQALPKIIEQAMELKEKGVTLLAPTMKFSPDKGEMSQIFFKLGETLGKGGDEVRQALHKAQQAQIAFEGALKTHMATHAKEAAQQEKVFVIIGKTYVTIDPVLNMGIPEKLAGMGYRVILYHDLPLPEHEDCYPDMNWPFGKKILAAARYVTDHPHAYAIFLSNHGCGPDTVLTHLFRERMQSKPYLNIEIDEHASAVGVLTRIEAFVHSLNMIDQGALKQQHQTKEQALTPLPAVTFSQEEKEDRVCILPYCYPYAEIMKEIAVSSGIAARVLPMTGREEIEAGRRHASTNEYLSLIALLGGILQEAEKIKSEQARHALFVPRTVTAEVSSQYHTFINMKLGQEGYQDLALFTPYIEDLVSARDAYFTKIFLGVLAGDLVMSADYRSRERLLQEVIDQIQGNNLRLASLARLAAMIAHESHYNRGQKKIQVIGDPLIIFNDFLNNFTFRNIEKQHYRLVYGSCAEQLWMHLKEYVTQQKEFREDIQIQERLTFCQNSMQEVSRHLHESTPFESDQERLSMRADSLLGSFAGAGGRYRAAKMAGDVPGIAGVIMATSMYENTGIIMNQLQKGWHLPENRAFLKLAFDGNLHEDDRVKIASFLYYL